jgi:hypothetical protein
MYIFKYSFEFIITIILPLSTLLRLHVGLVYMKHIFGLQIAAPDMTTFTSVTSHQILRVAI